MATHTSRPYYYQKIFVDMTGSDISDMRALRQKLEQDYSRFFKELAREYDNNATARSDLRDVLDAIKDVTATLTLVISKNSVSRSDAKTIEGGMDTINTAVSFYRNQMEHHAEFAEVLDAVKMRTGIALDDLNASRDIVHGSIRQAMRPGAHRAEQWKESAIGETTANITKGLIASITGPFYSLFEAGYNATKFTADKLRAHVQSGRTQNFAERLSTHSGIPTDVSVGRQNAPSLFNPIVPAVYPVAGASFTRKDLYLFFNTEAYKANWTRDLLQTLKRLSGQDKGRDTFSDSIKAGFAGGIGGLASGVTTGLLTGLAKTTVTVALAAIAAKAGWELGQALHTVFYGTEDEQAMQKLRKARVDNLMVLSARKDALEQQLNDLKSQDVLAKALQEFKEDLKSWYAAPTFKKPDDVPLVTFKDLQESPFDIDVLSPEGRANDPKSVGPVRPREEINVAPALENQPYNDLIKMQKELLDAIKALQVEISGIGEKRVGPVKTPGNIFDSSNPLGPINLQSLQGLDITGR